MLDASPADAAPLISLALALGTVFGYPVEDAVFDAPAVPLLPELDAVLLLVDPVLLLVAPVLLLAVPLPDDPVEPVPVPATPDADFVAVAVLFDGDEVELPTPDVPTAVALAAEEPAVVLEHTWTEVALLPPMKLASDSRAAMLPVV